MLICVRVNGYAHSTHLSETCCMNHQSSPWHDDRVCVETYLQTMVAMCPDLKDAHLDYFRPKLFVSRYKAKTNLFEHAQVHQKVGFVLEGLIRAFYTDDKGDEISSWFVSEFEFVTDYPAFLTGKPSMFCFEALEPVTVVWLPKDAIFQAYSDFHAFEKYGRLIAEGVILMQQARIESFLFKSAKQRYLEFDSTCPNVIHRISLAHLASYIGIERQSLTRIRKELKAQE